MNSKKLCSIIIPVFNEEEVLEIFWSRLESAIKESEFRNKHKTEILFIDDGSTDKSVEFLDLIQNNSKKIKIKVISLTRNFGHQAALICGYRECQGNFIVTIDADLQDPPELIVELISNCLAGSDIVMAQRTQRKGESFFKKITAHMFYSGLNFFSDTKIPRNVGDFRCVSRRALNTFLKLNEADPYIRGMFAWIGYRQAYVPYSRDPRFAGKSKYTFSKMIKLARSGVIGFSGNPIRIPFYVSFFSGVSGISLACYFSIAKIVEPNNSIPGYTSLMIVILLAFSVQFFILGILGEYLLKNLIYAQKRPEYLVKEES
jgi:glycosyltransferase involved in cell wall biosynthesis